MAGLVAEGLVDGRAAVVERRVDALIVIPAPGDAGYVAAEIHHGLVVVSLDRPMEGALVDTVVVDNVEGAAAAVSALAALGHRRASPGARSPPCRQGPWRG